MNPRPTRPPLDRAAFDAFAARIGAPIPEVGSPSPALSPAPHRSFLGDDDGFHPLPHPDDAAAFLAGLTGSLLRADAAALDLVATLKAWHAGVAPRVRWSYRARWEWTDLDPLDGPDDEAVEGLRSALIAAEVLGAPSRLDALVGGDDVPERRPRAAFEHWVAREAFEELTVLAASGRVPGPVPFEPEHDVGDLYGTDLLALADPFVHLVRIWELGYGVAEVSRAGVHLVVPYT